MNIREREKREAELKKSVEFNKILMKEMTHWAEKAGDLQNRIEKLEKTKAKKSEDILRFLSWVTQRKGETVGFLIRDAATAQKVMQAGEKLL